MTTSTKFMRRCQGGQPTGITEQSAVAPTFLDATFHRAQARLKSNPRCDLRAESSRPLFNPEFASLESKDNLRRLFEYRQKLANLEAVA